MTECEKNNELLSAWLDGELSPAESQALERHVAECAACRRTVDRWRRITDAARDVPERPEAAWDEIRSRVAERAERRRVIRVVGWRVAAAGALAAAAAALLISVHLVFPPGGPAVKAELPQASSFQLLCIDMGTSRESPVVIFGENGRLPAVILEGSLGSG